MERLGRSGGLAARLDDHVLRLVGLAFVGWSSAVTATSVTTDYGLAAPEYAAAATATADLQAVATVAAFALAHPAYLALLFAGLVMVVLGEKTPLLG